MNLDNKRLIALAIVTVTSVTALAEQNIPLHMQTYLAQGIDSVDQNRGRQLWYSTVNERSCTSCHGDDPASIGKHVKTGKTIQPMALSANGERYQKARKVEKWFFRNCKWTFGRQCTTQEKVDILSWLSTQ